MFGNRKLKIENETLKETVAELKVSLEKVNDANLILNREAMELRGKVAKLEEQLNLTKDALDVVKKKAAATKKSTSTKNTDVNKTSSTKKTTKLN